MKKVDNLQQRFLRLVLPCDIAECLAGLRFHIDFCVGFAKGQSVANTTGHAVLHALHQKLSEADED
ncbi:hypothetical protein SDC9_109644 [bioreactor metagenome]|uniref:Uncharacterized protein n=1 Tax=bioreactor metagenome TaxID=1076179 RepID=A0A645BCE7_9ZZZZ